MSEESRHGEFPATSPTLVALAADPRGAGWRPAWERFFQAYWRPLYAYLRRTGTPAQEALDVLQDFFVAGLDGRLLGAWDRERGRLRTYLLACLANHRRKAWRRDRARAEREVTPWRDAAEPVPEPEAGDPEAGFERDWARALQQHAIESVTERLRGEGAAADARILREWVLAVERPSADALGAALGLERGALYVRATRLRQALVDEVERRIRWLEARPEALAQERDAVLALFRQATP